MNEKKYCGNCRYEDATNRIHENEMWKAEEMGLRITAFPAVWCKRRNEYIDGDKSQSVGWCSYFEHY
ncbi:MAG: hypothetical protein B6244_08560 [Candidatus Cloacimonetes bacterium 4572_55]|nr:MAG: hypothetical protein B6244_08560 [Candidatus Cloacimonetes bacterium 4572_55]